ncbi:MAG: DinB family protein [Bacteroidia bacterium]|nr:DinB family protein [Bacteroidia bacterium]
MPDHPLWFRLLLDETRRRLLEESIPRTRRCLGLLSDAELWHRPNANSNSAGNLILHLCGNARQWIVSTLGGEPDLRRRQAEFDERGPVPRGELEALLSRLDTDLRRTLDVLTPEQVLARHSVQVFEESGMAILIHVVEHFSYHVGQLTYLTKALKDLDTGYYAGQPLETPGA